VIVGVEGEPGGQYAEVRVRLAFSHPTRPGLVACRHYLAGRCSRGPDCRWSHGEAAPLGSLRPWREADYSRLGPGVTVLARGPDGVWARAEVLEELMGEFLVSPATVGSLPFPSSPPGGRGV
jgi:hypothetical protein